MFVLIAPDSKSSVNGSETMVVSAGGGPGKVGGRAGRAGAFVAGRVCAFATVAKTRQAAAVSGRKYGFRFMPEFKFGRGSKARKIIFPAQGFWRLAAFAQFSQTQGIVPFGQPPVISIQHQRAMGKFRGYHTKRAIKQKLPRRADEQIRATHHLGDLHRRVIRNTRELIGRNIVMPPDDKIAKIFSSHEFLCSIISVRERNRLAVGNAETPAKFTR